MDLNIFNHDGANTWDDLKLLNPNNIIETFKNNVFLDAKIEPYEIIYGFKVTDKIHIFPYQNYDQITTDGKNIITETYNQTRPYLDNFINQIKFIDDTIYNLNNINSTVIGKEIIEDINNRNAFKNLDKNLTQIQSKFESYRRELIDINNIEISSNLRICGVFHRGEPKTISYPIESFNTLTNPDNPDLYYGDLTTSGRGTASILEFDNEFTKEYTNGLDNRLDVSLFHELCHVYNNLTGSVNHIVDEVSKSLGENITYEEHIVTGGLEGDGFKENLKTWELQEKIINNRITDLKNYLEHDSIYGTNFYETFYRQEQINWFYYNEKDYCKQSNAYFRESYNQNLKEVPFRISWNEGEEIKIVSINYPLLKEVVSRDFRLSDTEGYFINNTKIWEKQEDIRVDFCNS